MARVIQLELKRKATADSPLTPEMKDFIDRAIVPGLVTLYLAEQSKENRVAEEAAKVGQSPRSTATRGGLVRP